MLKWSPIKDIRNIKPNNCIYTGELEVYPQDSISGEVSHGETKRSVNIYGIINNTCPDQVNFIASFDTSDKYEALKLNGSHNITGIVRKSGRYAKTKYKLGFSCTLLDLETCETNKTYPVKDNNDNNVPYLQYFKGIGKLDYVPWSHLEPISINYYTYKNKLAYITFTLTQEQYNTWMEFKEYNLTVFDYGNIKKVLC